MKQYIESCTAEEIENIIKIRLNMEEFKCNFKGRSIEVDCPLCGEQKDTTEHVFECKTIKSMLGKIDLTSEDIEKEDIKTLKKVDRFFKQVMTIRKQLDRD